SLLEVVIEIPLCLAARSWLEFQPRDDWRKTAGVNQKSKSRKNCCGCENIALTGNQRPSQGRVEIEFFCKFPGGNFTHGRFGWTRQLTLIFPLPRYSFLGLWSADNESGHRAPGAGLFLGRSALGVKAIAQPVLDLGGIAENVAFVEAKHFRKVMDSSDIAIGDTRLDHMLPFASQKLAIEDSFQRRRLNFERSAQHFPVHQIAAGKADAAIWRNQPLSVKRIPQRKFRANRPPAPMQRQREIRVQVETSDQSCSPEERLTPGNPFKRRVI